MAFSLATLAERLNASFQGEGGVVLSSVADLKKAQKENLSFCNHPKFIPLLEKTQAGAVIVAGDLLPFCPTNALIHPNPYAAYARAAQWLHPFKAPFSGVHHQVESLSPLPDDIAIDAFTRIGKNVRLGSNVVIFSGCTIGEGTSIGDDTVIYPNVVIYPHCIIGSRVVLHSGAVIGADGFGFAPENEGWIKIPQKGAVVIGDDVEIGANSTIDRGTLENTVIEKGCKIDNLVHIAHNCTIGENTVMAACTGVAGSVKIGKHCMLGGAAMISGHLELGDNVVVSGGSLVMKSIPTSGRYTSVFPLDTHANWIQNAAHIRHLKQLNQRVKQLEKLVEKFSPKE